MARRPRVNEEDVSLFPFLSIIASVIGVLTMMIATMALAQTDTPDVAQIEDYQKTNRQIKETENSIAALQQKISVSNSATLELRQNQKELTITIEELKNMLAELERIEKELAEQQQVQIIIPEVDPKDRETASDIQRNLDRVREEIAQLEKALKLRTDVPTEGNVTVLPQGSGLHFKPHFVECSDDSIVLHTMAEPKRIPTGAILKDKDFLDLLTLVVNGKDDSIVFLVRSNGLQTYRFCRNQCNSRDIRNGKIPVVGQGRIDLSAFVEKRKR